MANTNVLIGGHVAGGIAECITYAEVIGAETIQIFGASPRTWRTKIPDADTVAEFKKQLKKSGVRSVFLHAPYLVNLASASPDILAFSIQSLTDHFRIADMIGSDGLIFHLGSSKGLDRKTALDQEVRAIQQVIKNVPGATRLIMENAAGGGDKIGAQIEEIAYLYKKIGSKRMKVCFDTAHGFEAGIIQEYTKDTVKKLVDDFDAKIGIENLVAIHANDSKTAYASNHDRHENIGEGHIGLQGFKALASEKRLRDKAWLLEVPGFDDMGPDKKNMELLRKCFS